jgi:hypothetical protein
MRLGSPLPATWGSAAGWVNDDWEYAEAAAHIRSVADSLGLKS